jgi:hypothetical protein
MIKGQQRFKPEFLGGGAVLCLGLFLTLGCGDDTGLPQRYPVYGTVTYKGEPVAKGQITFLPKKPDGRAANGFIQDGRYTLTTATDGDGALPGEYGVQITAKEADQSKIAETIRKEGGGARQIDVGRAAAKAKNLVPPKYQLPETSKLEAVVKEQSNKFDFDLTD